MAKEAELLETLGDFTSKENWDNFFSIRGSGDAFEWYADWSDLRNPILSHLPPPLSNPEILVPGCGSSRLSDHLYDAGFTAITNIDFSKVAISDCLRRNVRDRPRMKWRVMDMTAMQVFSHLFCLQLEEDVNEVIFALPSASCIKEDDFTKATLQLEKLLKLEHPEISQSILDASRKIRHLKWLHLDLRYS